MITCACTETSSAETGGPPIQQPRIYYGEETDTDVIVKGSTPEFDYPKGKDNIHGTYQGRAGLPLAGTLEEPSTHGISKT